MVAVRCGLGKVLFIAGVMPVQFLLCVATGLAGCHTCYNFYMYFCVE